MTSREPVRVTSAEDGEAVSRQQWKWSVAAVRFEHRDSALGIGTAEPRLSWQFRTDEPGWAQTAYEVERDGGEVVRVDSAEQVLVPWPFAPLAARERATVRVRVASGPQWSDWSEPATVEAGLLTTSDWPAKFVSPRTIEVIGQRAPVVSRTWTARGPVASARLYVTARGVYVATLNGTRVGDEVLALGWTSYRHRLRYRTHDSRRCCATARTRSTCCSATAGSAAGSAGPAAAASTVTAPRCWPSWR